MTGLIFDIKRYAVHDGPGIRSTVFMKGCPLCCWWCHNPESIRKTTEELGKKKLLDGMEIQTVETIGKQYSPEELVNELNKDVLFFDESDGGVTFSGGEPFVQWQFLREATRLCKEQKLHVAVDTTGYVRQDILSELSENIDLFLYDLKHLDSEKHKQFTGVSNERIIDNFNFLIKSNKRIIVRFPVIPRHNDTEENLVNLERFLGERSSAIEGLHLLPYHNLANAKYENCERENRVKELNSLREEDLLPIKSRFEKIGLEVKIGG